MINPHQKPAGSMWGTIISVSASRAAASAKPSTQYAVKVMKKIDRVSL